MHITLQGIDSLPSFELGVSDHKSLIHVSIILMVDLRGGINVSKASSHGGKSYCRNLMALLEPSIRISLAVRPRSQLVVSSRKGLPVYDDGSAGRLVVDVLPSLLE